MHIGFIMDGNGRWALRNGLTRAEGHEQGIEKANEIMMACVKRKIARATFYAFSVQNWSRDRSEIETIYSAGRALFERMRPWVKENNVAVKCVGNKFNLMDKEETEENPKVRAAIELGKALMAETANNTGTIITLCVSYGGREEILDVFRKIKEPLHTLTTTMISDFFQIPDVDLVVRTSGEYRISNFLLWQSAYAEYYFTDKMWPEFNELQLDKAIDAYRRRDRRFGTVGAKPALQSPEDLKEVYAELLSTPAQANTEADLKALYANLLKNKEHTFSSLNKSYSKSELQKAYESVSLANPGAVRIFVQLEDLPQSAIDHLARDLSIETLDHVLKRSTRLDYIDTTKEEKEILQILCKLKATTPQFPFLHRISIAYYQLKLHLKHLVHEDALTLYAILVAVCEDVVDRKFHQTYFDREDLKTILFQVLRDTLEMEAETNREVRDLFTYSCLAVLFHYFDEPNPAIPTSSLEFNIWLGTKLKELAADRFIDESDALNAS